ncbi:Phage protein [Salmonella phage Tennessee]|uniref:Uncharacterized protein n=1 Tax=Escherichia phage HildyBeyeler TaxID=2852005 RepID=A0AAE7VTA7_9CAUD|nr:hypothetical protein bas33_0102 [Escherichia phage HildyBeyeler]
MSKNVIAQLEVHRDSTINNIKCRQKDIEAQKADLLMSIRELNVRKEFLKELNAAIEKLKAE